ncbi:MAG: hypothetical protein EHM43_11325, partial [Ignavibacteriae bacterium]
MAKFTNQLDLDVSPFLAGLAKAKGEASKIDDTLTVGLDVDTSEVDAAVGKVNKLDGQKATVEIDADTTKLEGGFKDALKGIGDQVKGGDFGGAFDAISSSVGAALPGLAAITAGIGAVGAVLGDTIAKGREFNDAIRQVSLQTGLAADEMAGLEESARNAFVRGVGESAADAVKTLGSLKQTLGSAIKTDALDDAA